MTLFTVLSWYLFYRPPKDERHIQPGLNLSHAHKNGQKYFAGRAEDSASSSPR